jgi:aryl-alcohol dehydrogenase-like predicted oxidoreductase
MCRELGLGVTPWGPLAGGVLAGKYTREDMERERRERKPDDLYGTNEQRMPMLTEKKLEIAETVKEIAEQTGRSPSQVALNWLLAQPGVASLVVGARKLSQLEDNLASLDFALDEKHLDRLNQASQIELGFPHETITSPVIRNRITGDTDINLP